MEKIGKSDGGRADLQRDDSIPMLHLFEILRTRTRVCAANKRLGAFLRRPIWLQVLSSFSIRKEGLASYSKKAAARTSSSTFPRWSEPECAASSRVKS